MSLTLNTLTTWIIQILMCICLYEFQSMISLWLVDWKSMWWGGLCKFICFTLFFILLIVFVFLYNLTYICRKENMAETNKHLLVWSDGVFHRRCFGSSLSDPYTKYCGALREEEGATSHTKDELLDYTTFQNPRFPIDIAKPHR